MVLVCNEGDHHSSTRFKWSIDRSLIIIGFCELILQNENHEHVVLKILSQDQLFREKHSKHNLDSMFQPTLYAVLTDGPSRDNCTVVSLVNAFIVTYF